MTLIQYRSFVYLLFNLLIYSLVIKIATLVKRAVLFGIRTPASGLIKLSDEELIVEADPINNSLIKSLLSFHSKFNTPSLKTHYQFQVILISFHDRVFPFGFLGF